MQVVITLLWSTDVAPSLQVTITYMQTHIYLFFIGVPSVDCYACPFYSISFDTFLSAAHSWKV